ncbi:MAG: thioesterase family protein [Chloroflexi bacterium]|nr:thioesterase family protein [Chloroflexota bacterium]
MLELVAGLEGELTQTVTKELTAAAYGSGLVAAFATPVMIGLMEGASVEAIKRALAPGQTSVGIEVNIKHLAATPVGMQVRARSKVIGVEGRRVTFQVEAWDDKEKIGEGTHTRMIMDDAKFRERFEQKMKAM